MKTGLLSITLISALCMTTAAVGEIVSQKDVQRAQGEMLMRVQDAVNRYARQINIEHGYVNYCSNELHLRTREHPADGFIPFGVNYKKITDSETLALILSSHENYERSFLILCLANAKNTLREAGQP